MTDIWWFPCQTYRIHTVYIRFWPNLVIKGGAGGDGGCGGACGGCRSILLTKGYN